MVNFGGIWVMVWFEIISFLAESFRTPGSDRAWRGDRSHIDGTDRI
jgi:hypothetical protein